MLEDLVGVDNVERGVVIAQREEVTHLETKIVQAQAGYVSLGLGYDFARSVQTHHLARCDQSGQVRRDRARSATDIEQRESWAQVGEEVCR
jgi:hypothetical protein